MSHVAIGTVRERTSRASRVITLVAVLAPPLALLSAAGLLWGVAISWVDVALFGLFYVLCGLGTTVGYHRLFTHRSFETKRWLRATFAVLGSMTMQGPVTQWVTDHRRHHALSDQEGDPHSPHAGHGIGVWARVKGFAHAHVGWLFRSKGMERGEHYGRDLFQDPWCAPSIACMRSGSCSPSGCRSCSATSRVGSASRSAFRRLSGPARSASSRTSTPPSP